MLARDKHSGRNEGMPTFGQVKRSLYTFSALCWVEAFVSLGLPLVDYNKAAEFLAGAQKKTATPVGVG